MSVKRFIFDLVILLVLVIGGLSLLYDLNHSGSMEQGLVHVVGHVLSVLGIIALLNLVYVGSESSDNLAGRR